MDEKQKLSRELKALIREKAVQNQALKNFIEALQTSGRRSEESKSLRLPISKDTNPK